jgi:hypothetical protein
MAATTPLYWKDERPGGELRPAIEAYLTDKPLSEREICLIRGYLQHWIVDGEWKRETSALVDLAMSLSNRAQIDLWLERALRLGIDPL